MPISITITPQDDAFDPYAAFNTSYGKQLLKLFKAGAKLCLWRCTTPWNLYLETKRGDQYAICGKDEGEEGHGSTQGRGLQNLAKPGGNSGQRIRYALSRSEVGQLEKEWWLYDEVRARAAEELWAKTQELRKQRAAHPTAFAPNVIALSETAQALLRTLRHGRYHGIQRYPELDDAFAELDAQGLLEMRENGRFTLVAAANDLRLTRGQQLKFV
jgi:hypothetical protein